MIIYQIIHYSKEDPDCISDYWDIELFDEQGNLIAAYDDEYHGKGLPKTQGFIQGVKYATVQEVNLITVRIADRS